MKKARYSGQNLYTALLEYRNSPFEYGFTHTQLLMGCRTKSIIPISNRLLKPHTADKDIIQSKFKKSKIKQLRNYDKTTKSLPPLCIN